jgi:hypothetical protein
LALGHPYSRKLPLGDTLEPVVRNWKSRFLQVPGLCNGKGSNDLSGSGLPKPPQTWGSCLLVIGEGRRRGEDGDQVREEESEKSEVSENNGWI